MVFNAGDHYVISQCACSMSLLVFWTQRLNNKSNYSRRESDKIITNKLTIIDISRKEWQLFTYINEKYVAKNEFLLQENLSELFKLECVVSCKEIKSFCWMYWGLKIGVMKSSNLLGVEMWFCFMPVALD